MMRRLLKWALCLALISAATFAALPLFERGLLYPFDPRQVAPVEAALPNVTHHQLTSSTGKSLVIWAATPAPGQPVIFYLHGNAGNLSNRAGRFKHFLNRGYGLVALAYPGSSGSAGWPSEDALMQAANTTFEAMHPTTGALRAVAGDAPVVLYGESLGAAVGINLLSDILPSKPGHTAPTALILEAPFTSLSAMVQRHYPALSSLQAIAPSQWNVLPKIAELHAPLLVLHGTDDPLTPIEMGRQIHAAAPSQNKVFVAAQGAQHLDLWRSDTLPQIWHFIDRYAAFK